MTYLSASDYERELKNIILASENFITSFNGCINLLSDDHREKLDDLIFATKEAKELINDDGCESCQL
jgi:hypothetical protein